MRAPLRGHALTLDADGPAGRFSAVLPAGAAGNWCRLAVSVAHADAAWWVKLEATDEARGQVVREAFLGRQRGLDGRKWRNTLVHLPGAAVRLTFWVFTAASCRAEAPFAVLRVLSRREAAFALLARGWPALPRALAGDARGVLGRVRAMLGQHPARTGEAPPYGVWTTLYDEWLPLRDVLVRLSDGISIDVAVIGGDAAARVETLASLHRQWVAPARIDVVEQPADWRAGDSAWVLVMQAGEVLAPHGLACFAAALRRDPGALGFYADLDCITAHGRADPLFKPQPDPWLVRSGLLTRGACLFRAGVLHDTACDTATWRRAAAISASTSLRGIPLILTHVPGGQSEAAANAPVTSSRSMPSVSVIIPTSARGGHTLRCLRRVVARTAYADIEILLAVSSIDPGDARQAANLAEAAEFPFVRVLDMQQPAFNYAAVNNKAVRQARGDLVLLLNDDVVPLGREWLQNMVAFVNGGPVQADIVGVRLLYGNGLVQHGGVTLGLANLCEHSFRLSAKTDPGPHGLALLNRQVSAVTAACMLVRRSLYETLGGMDDAFAVALNDVDFCLRAGQVGARVVLAAEVVLIHYESLSLGRHYEGARAHLEAVEVRRLRERWAEKIADDPHYSFSASLEPGREFQPGFPPRNTPSLWCRGDLPDND